VSFSINILGGAGPDYKAPIVASQYDAEIGAVHALATEMVRRARHLGLWVGSATINGADILAEPKAPAT